jgi:hypothetical protein
MWSKWLHNQVCTATPRTLWGPAVPIYAWCHVPPTTIIIHCFWAACDLSLCPVCHLHLHFCVLYLWDVDRHPVNWAELLILHVPVDAPLFWTLALHGGTLDLALKGKCRCLGMCMSFSALALDHLFQELQSGICKHHVVLLDTDPCLLEPLHYAHVVRWGHKHQCTTFQALHPPIGPGNPSVTHGLPADLPLWDLVHAGPWTWWYTQRLCGKEKSCETNIHKEQITECGDWTAVHTSAKAPHWISEANVWNAMHQCKHTKIGIHKHEHNHPKDKHASVCALTQEERVK